MPWGVVKVASQRPSRDIPVAQCPATEYSDCFGDSDFALAFLNTSFQHTMAYGYDDSYPSSVVVYTAGVPAGLAAHLGRLSRM